MTESQSLKPTIIVRLPNWIGDVCMCLPALEALRQTGHPLIICARAWAQGLISQFSPDDFVSLNGQFMADRRAIAHIPKDIRRNALGLIMPDSLSSAALFAINGIESCGYQDDGRSLLLRHASRKPDHPVHAVHKWWLLTEFALKQWNVHSPFLQHNPPPFVLLDVSDQDQSVAKQALRAHGLDDQPFVLVAPTATGKHKGKVKVWPHFAALVTELKKQGHPVVMCPPANEREQAVDTVPDALLLDPLPLKSFCALTQMAELVVCNDSGVSHLAAASRAKQLTLFGVTDPRHTGPWSEHAAQLGHQGQWPSLAAALTQVKAMLGQPINPIEKPASAQSI